MPRLLALALSALAACSGGNAGPAAAPPPASGEAPEAGRRVPGEYLVTLAPGAGPEAIEAAFGSAGVRRVRPLGRDRWLFAVGEDPGPERMEALRAGDARVLAVQPNFVYRGSGP